MKQLLPLLLVIFLVNPLVTQAQTMEKKHEVALMMATKTIDKIERNLNKMEKADRSNPNAQIVYKGNSMERDFKKATDKISSLPQSATKVQNAEQRIQQLKQAWTAVQKSYENAQAADASSEMDWNNFKATKQYKKEMESIRGYEKLFSERLKLDVDFPNGAWIQNSMDNNYTGRLSLLENWNSIKQEIANYRATYAKYERFSGDPMPEIKRIEGFIKQREEELNFNLDNGLKLISNRQERLEAQIKDAFERHQAALNVGQSYTGIDEMVLAPNSFPMQTVREVERVVELNAAYDEGFITTASSALTKLKATYEAAAKKAAEYTMASKEKPVNEYAGSDYDKLVASVKKRFSGQKVIGIFFDRSWSRVEEYRFDASYGSARKVNYSVLNGKVYLAHNGEFALERIIHMQKDHLAGDALRVFGDFRQYGSNPPLRVLFPMNKF